jgi:hypothetical protein
MTINAHHKCAADLSSLTFALPYFAAIEMNNIQNGGLLGRTDVYVSDSPYHKATLSYTVRGTAFFAGCTS